MTLSEITNAIGTLLNTVERGLEQPSASSALGKSEVVWTELTPGNRERIATFRRRVLNYGSTAGLVLFPQITLLGVGAIDCVLAHHVPLGLNIDDFVLICDETGRKRPVQHLQLEALCRFWNVKSYILVDERQYGGSTRDDGGPLANYNLDHFVRLVICRASRDTGWPPLHQFASVAGDAEVILRHEDIDLPSREEFLQRLSARLRRTMLSQIREMVKQKEADYALSRCLPALLPCV